MISVSWHRQNSAAMSVRSKIILAMEMVAKEHKRVLAPLTDDLVLLESGLDSLSFAVLVVRLEDELNVDPFDSAESNFPVTLREFIAAYERATQSDARD